MARGVISCGRIVPGLGDGKYRYRWSQKDRAWVRVGPPFRAWEIHGFYHPLPLTL